MNSMPKQFLDGALCIAFWCGALLISRGGEDRPLSAGGPVLWDTAAPLLASVIPQDRSSWNAVPRDLLRLEVEPAKASSDPGYYGREYEFGGDAVVETASVVALFSTAKGSVSFYIKKDGPATGGPAGSASPVKAVEIAPIFGGSGPVTMRAPELVRNAGDRVILNTVFLQPGSAPATCTFAFDKTGIIEARPGENLKQVHLAGSLAYGVVPGFIGDDLVYGGANRPANKIAIPTEHIFVGLVEGGNAQLVMTWPKEEQRMSLGFGEGQAQNVITSVEFDTAGASFFLALPSAPGIWHKENLTPDFLEKDRPIEWKPPFPAKWKTQLVEEDLKTTFGFRAVKGEIWRGVAGSFVYPVWFSDGKAFYHLGKKIQPEGESVIYCLEGEDTPLTTLTPTDVLQQTLGRQAAADILDFAGRKLRTHHRRGAAGVRRACTCGCTESIQAVFQKHTEDTQQEHIKAEVDDMIYFIRRHLERIDEYRRMADVVAKQLEDKKRAASPELKAFLETLQEIAKQIPEECERQKDNMKSLKHADELAQKTLALASRKDPNNLKAYMELLKAWRDMGGAQDYVVAKCHVITRNLFQTAGYGCATVPAALPFARQVRTACRQTLRNPDGYEIWADY